MKTVKTRMRGVIDPIVLGFLLAAAGTAVGLNATDEEAASKQDAQAAQVERATVTEVARTED